MNGPPHDEGRPPAKDERPANVVTTDTHILAEIPRCRLCHAPLTAAVSVRRLLGPTCHRKALHDVVLAFRLLVEGRPA